MATHHLRVVCSEQGCNETRHYDYPNRKEYNEAIIRHKNSKCTRHLTPEKVLGLNNLIVTKDLENKESSYENLKNRMFWDGKNGFIYGEGFKAFSEDFPKGTVLRITAQIILPENV